MIYLHDGLGIAKDGALIPQQLAPLLSLCDGTRDISALRSGLLMRTGATLPEGVINDILGQLDDALLLENGAYQEAAALVVQRYRQAKHRLPSHAGACVSVRRRATDADDGGLLCRNSGVGRRRYAYGQACGDALPAHRLRARA